MVSFQRVVREIVYEEGKKRNLTFQLRMQSRALLALQEAVEGYLVDLFRDSQFAAAHAKRVTVEPCDLQLVRYYKGDEWKLRTDSKN